MAIAQPSISISCRGQIDQSSARIISFSYRRAVSSIGELPTTPPTMGPVQYAYAVRANGQIETPPPEMEPVAARSMVATGQIDNSSVSATPSYMRSVSAKGEFADAAPVFVPSYHRSVVVDGDIDNSGARCQPAIAYAMSAHGQIDQASASITRMYRQFLPPPPQGVLNLIRSDQQVRLFGSPLYAGDGYRVAVIVRGYNLTFLTLNYGPHLLFTAKGSPNDPDSTFLFRKSTILPYSGISVQNVRDVEIDANGTLQELTAQMRLYPEDTQSITASVIYYELELVDPLSERVTLEVGSFQLVGGVRGR